MFATMLAAALALCSVGPSGLARAAPPLQSFNLDVELKLVPDHVAMCVGQTREIEATVYGARWLVGSPRPPSWPLNNVRIRMTYASGGREIVELQHAEEIPTSLFWDRTKPPVARFQIKAKKIGSTSLSFTTKGTAPSNGPRLETAPDQQLRVDVTGCYEAQVGALGTDWSISQVCEPDKPFKLEGSYPGLSSTATLSFYPNANDWHTGTYVLVQTAAVICKDQSSGPYKFTEYPDQRRADIDLAGPSVSFCPQSGSVRTPNVQYAIQLLVFDPSSRISGSCVQLSPP